MTMLALALAGLATPGCNAFAPSGVGGRSASFRQEKEAKQLAANDPFPTPAEAGMETPAQDANR